MAFWSSETHAKDSTPAGFPAGSRTKRPHSPTGWTTNRTTEASAPLKTVAEPGGFFAGGRTRTPRP
jgi:hypothetical protein